MVVEKVGFATSAFGKSFAAIVVREVDDHRPSFRQIGGAGSTYGSDVTRESALWLVACPGRGKGVFRPRGFLLWRHHPTIPRPQTVFAELVHMLDSGVPEKSPDHPRNLKKGVEHVVMFVGLQVRCSCAFDDAGSYYRCSRCSRSVGRA